MKNSMLSNEVGQQGLALEKQISAVEEDNIRAKRKGV